MFIQLFSKVSISERIEQLEKDVKELKSKLWLLENPQRFKSGDKVNFEYYNVLGGTVTITDFTIINVGRLTDFNRYYYLYRGENINNIFEYNEKHLQFAVNSLK